MHTAKDLIMRVTCCLFTIKTNTSSYINRLTLTLHVTIRCHFQFETNIPTKINSNKDDTDSEREKLKTRAHSSNFKNKRQGKKIVDFLNRSGNNIQQWTY
jgi:phage gp45-like